MRTSRICVSIFLLIVSLVAGLSAQTYQGSINGAVTDATGAIIPGATVVITNVAQGTSRTLTTNGAGEYTAPNLEPGLYTITATAQNFGKTEVPNIRVEVARAIRQDIKLSTGTVTESVTVNEQSPVVDTTNDVLQGTFNNEAIVSLPLQGRDFENLVTLQPGIQRTPGGGFLSVTSNGNRFEDNNYIVDGIDDNDAYYGETVINAAGVQGTPATHLPIDAIQEFNVQESPEAEYGFKPGAIIQLGLKSGTNALHGTAYYFHRNAAFDARNYYNPTPAPTSALILHQYGGSLGGPVVKDKLFFFANYEGVRDKVGNPLDLQTPLTTSVGDPTVSLPDAIAACTAAGTCNPLSLQIAQFFPANTTGSTTRAFDFNNTNREDNGVAKLDYHLNEKNTISGRYVVGDSIQTEEDFNVLNPMFLSSAVTNAQVLGATWSYTPNSAIVNQLRFGYNRFWQQIVSNDSNHPASFYGINTGVTNPVNYGFPEITFSKFERLGGNPAWPLLTTPNSTYQINDAVSWTLGKHSLHFGGEYRTGSSDNLRDRFGKGRIRFRSLEDFVTGNYRDGEVFVGNSQRSISQSSFGAFVQDEWRATPKLSISSGLRYDLTLPIHEAHDLLGNFDPTVGIEQVGQNISQPYNTNHLNFSPRLGVAYDVFGNGKTVLRAGGGIIYEIPHISLYVGQNGADATGLNNIPTQAFGVGNIVSGPTTLQDLNYTLAGPVFGSTPTSSLTCDVNTPCAILAVARNIKTPYVANWNFNIQQAFSNTTTLQVAYVGNRGIHLYSLRDINQNQYALDVNGDYQSGRPYAQPNCGSTCYPGLSYVDYLENRDNSIYQGLQVTLTQRPRSGLNFVAGYTFAHAIDQATDNRSITWEDPTNGTLERGNGATDIRHRFTLAMNYSVPRFQHFDKLIGGWQMNTIVTLESGEPQDYYDGNDYISGNDEGTDRWNLFGDPKALSWSKLGVPYYDPTTFADDGNGHATAGNAACIAHASISQLETYGCYAVGNNVLTPPDNGTFGNTRRNSFIGPHFYNVDFSLNKTFKVSERFGLQLRGEVFNLLNHPNFAGINDDVSNPGCSSPDGVSACHSLLGQPNYTPDVAASNPVVGSGGSRHIQVGLKLTF